MIRRLLPVLLLCGAAWSQDQLPTPAQVCTNSGATCAFLNNVTSGNIVFIGGHSEGALTTPTDTRSTTWTLIDSHAGGAGAYLWCGILASGGAETITLTGALSFSGQVSVEFPISYGWTCTKDASANGATNVGTVTTSNITTAQNGDLLICYMSNVHSASQPIPANGGSLLLVMMQSGSDASGMGYRFAGTNGSYNCVFDGGSDANAGYVLAAFKPSAVNFVTASLPTAALTNSYSYTPQCVGGVGAYTWSISSGALPTGLSINSGTGAITGTPTGPSTTPTIKCNDGTNFATIALPLTVNSSAGTPAIVSSCLAGGSTCSLGTVTSQNCIVVISPLSGLRIAPPTDSLNTVFRYVGTQSMTTVIQGFMGMWLGKATSTGADTITISDGAVTTGAAQISNAQCGFSDAATSKAGVDAGSVTISGAAITTLAPASEIFSGLWGWSSGSTWTAGTGFANVDSVGGAGPMQTISANESSTGTYTPSFVQTGNVDGHWAEWGIALRPSTNGPVATGVRRHKTPIF